jgi:hypothetical protein
MAESLVAQRVVALLQPHLGRLLDLDGAGGATPSQALAARFLWRPLRAHAAARTELLEAALQAARTPTPQAREAFGRALGVLLDEEPSLAQTMRRRLEQVQDAGRHLVAAAACLAAVAAVLLTAITVSAWGAATPAGARLPTDWRGMALPAAGAAVALAVTGLLTYRRLPRALEWLLVTLALVVLVFAPDPDSVVNDVENGKLFALALLTLLPGWLYFAFVSSRGRILWEAFVVNLYRLRADDNASLPEPPRRTREHRLWEAAGGQRSPEDGTLYRRKFEAAYSSTVTTEGGGAGGRDGVRSEGFTPVWILTLLTAFGWIAVLTPTYPGTMVFGAGEFTFSDGEVLDWALGEALAFGFVGAYWFNVQSLLRRFFSNDLRTNAYVSASVRYVVVAALVAVAFAVSGLEGKPAQPWFNGVAFVIGVFPRFGLQLILKAVSKVVGRVTDEGQSFPLTQLDGLNMWYEARLLEEGIEDMENLATADMVDLLLATRVPVGRTVDWVDQSLLYLRVTDRGARERLRRLGIRTATDLLDVFPAAASTTRAAAWPERAALVARCIHGPEIDDPVTAVDTLLSSLEGETNLRHVRAWREFEARVEGEVPPAITLPEAASAPKRSTRR